MTSVSPGMNQPFPFRSSKRLTITVPVSIFETLSTRSGVEGRSLSNLAAYLLERALEQRHN